MLYFYKYLLKHGEEDGMPQLDKDLFFYIEVQKFKVGVPPSVVVIIGGVLLLVVVYIPLL